MPQQYEMFGGDHGHYTIMRQGNAEPVAFVRRNQTGGGYTVETADQSRKCYRIDMRNMPVGVMVANEIMLRLVRVLPSKMDTLEMYRRVNLGLDDDDMEEVFSRLLDELAAKFFEDTGFKIGEVYPNA